ncbi:hypothetical protein KM043_011023 [Ampulex compressa]|nr:hypothetical protein KM043_011023 [Ampulex compressa]
MCLLYEEQGCKTCNNERHIQNIGNYDCVPTNQLCNDNTIEIKNSVPPEEIVLPLELVINKDPKPRQNYFELTSDDCTTEIQEHNNGINFESGQETQKSRAANANIDGTNKLYIPKLEPFDMVLNIHAHLNDTNKSIIHSQTSYNDTATNVNNLENNSHSTNEEKSLNNKLIRNRDRSHISVLPGLPERYKCNVCNKVFKNKKGKCYHDACITGIRPYQCTFCDRSFVKRSHFEYHERVHSGYKPYKCNLCEKAFPQQNKLNRHMYSHSKEKQFICLKCNKGYSKRDDLRNHLSIHNGTTTYSCKVCDKTFKIQTNLKRHMRTHTSERPYTCDQCSKNFKDKSLLIRHKRTHGKERPYSCAHCNRLFLSKSELRRHLTVHSDEKPFSCKYCQTVFRRKDNLNRHIRHHHLENSNTDVNRSQSAVSNTNRKLVKVKQTHSKQKQKPKRIQKMNVTLATKSPAKMSVVYVNSRDQINSRLDSMGNITPVIRTTSEVSNAVPVINGPISIKKPEDKADTRKKTFTYTEPIPLAEAVVINRRIEEKLYPQNVSNHNYFFRNCMNRSDKQYTPVATQGNNFISRGNFQAKCNALTGTATYGTIHSQTSLSHTSFAPENLISPEVVQDFGIQNRLSTEDTIRLNKKNDQENAIDTSRNALSREVGIDNGNNVDSKQCNQSSTCVKPEQDNCVSTIKKHILQHFESNVYAELSSVNIHPEKVKDPLVSKNVEESKTKKQSNVHWRRRMAETLKPCND